jgi:hypothetical protein
LAEYLNGEIMKKHIILDEEQDKLLASICDSALKFHGMQIFNVVQKLISAVEEFSDESI